MKKILLFALLGFCNYISAQSFDLSGVIQDATSTETLPNATVVVLNATDSVYVNFALSNNDGEFKIQDIESGNYLLQITYLGYKQLTKAIELTEDLDAGVLLLAPTLNQLDDVIIEGERVPVIVKNDTLVYNADAFKTQPNDVVEDLLRKMPGIEVESDGTIIAQGEEVQQILVDGKEFFGKDPKIATKNLPAKAIDKVEVFDKKSEMAEFSGIDDGERQKTMNLELKEDHKQGYFGTVEAGYGTDERYNGRLSLNRFSPKLQMSSIGNLNNVNDQGFSVGEYMNFMSSLGGFGGGSNRIRLGQGDVPISQGLSNGFVNTAAGGLNMNYEFAEKTDLNVSYFVNSIENTIDRTTDRETFIRRDDVFYSKDTSNQSSSNLNNKLSLKFDHEIDSSQNFTISSNLSFNRADLESLNLSELRSNANILENTGDRAYQSDIDNYDVSGSLTYKKKFGSVKKRIFTFNTSLNNAENDFLGKLISENIFLPEDSGKKTIENLLQRQVQNDRDKSYQFRSSFVEPLGNNRYLEFNYRIQDYNTVLDRDVFDIIDQLQFGNTDLSNNYVRDYIYNRFGLGYHLNTEKTSLTLEANYQISNLDGELQDAQNNIRFNNKSFLPRVTYRYEFMRGHHINMRYNTNVREPSLDQLQPITDNTDPLNIYQGNPGLQPEYRHTFRTNYIKWDQFSFRSIFGFFTATYTKNKITNETIVDEQFRQISRPINIDSDLSTRTSLSYSSPLRSIGAKMRLSLSNRYQKSIVFINTRKNNVNRITNGVGITLENRSKDIIDFTIGTKWNFTNNLYSESDDRNQNYKDQNYFTDIIFTPNEKWSLETNFDFNIYSGQDFANEQYVPIWKASTSIFVMEGNRGEFKLSVFDILNQNLGISRTSSLNYIEEERIQSLGRYYMLSFIYNIKGLGQGNSGPGGRRMMITRG